MTEGKKAEMTDEERLDLLGEVTNGMELNKAIGLLETLKLTLAISTFMNAQRKNQKKEKTSGV